ncbi:hypothetical protein PIROE2DRAFT_17564 [Piromyces sp. E2]|nr:hypothetical protein PIROE2DRAFT_17564 [Piromyces sp. E2]|eukprot:OUM57450.1 hypothetical protein PIROE2DRAFT_17564 [Piromyces sp. E2]
MKENGHELLISTDQLNRWAEHYEDFAFDISDHSLNRDYWERIFRFNNRNTDTWDINLSNTTEEIKNTIFSMKNIKAPGLDGIPIKFYKAFFCNKDLEEKYPSASKCLEIIFNKIWNDSFPKNGIPLLLFRFLRKDVLCHQFRLIFLLTRYVLNKCAKYGVRIGSNRCCGGLFADDIVLIAPSKKKLQKMLSLVFKWANTHEMSFSVNKCATIVIKNIIFKNTLNYVDLSFYIDMYFIPKVTCYTYLGIPFDEDLLLKPNLSSIYKKIKKSLFSLKSFLSNNSFRIKENYCTVICHYFNSKRNSSNKKNEDFYERNSYISLYTLSRDLIILPLAGICATQQIKCFIKWRKSNCIIRDLIRDIPTILYKKLKKNNIKKINEIKEHYWIISPLNNGIKAPRYSNLQFKNSTSITRIGFQKSYLTLGIIWIIRICCGFENTTRIAIVSNRVTPDCSSYCPCCDHGEQTFLHWILLCPALTQYRTTSLGFIDELFNLF